jgi:subtilisin family serine protease
MRSARVGLVVGIGVSLLACGGFGSEAPPPVEEAPTLPADLKVWVDPDALKPGQPARERERGEAGVYLVKLARGYTVDDLRKQGAQSRGGAGALAEPGGPGKAGKGKAGKGGKAGGGRGDGGGGGGGGDDWAGGDPAMREPAADRDLDDYLGLSRTIQIRSTQPKEKVIAHFESLDCVEWIEPATTFRNQNAPNDPYFQYQWHMSMLQVPQAWSVTMGEGVVVAVVDTGVTAGQDGFHKLLPGRDFVDNDQKPDDLNGHGTHVAGTIAQAVNNRVGTIGVAPRAAILPVRVLDANGSGDNTQVASGITWAADHGANILNMSLGSPYPSELIADAVAYAYEKGVTVVAATGNDGNPNGISYPAAYDHVIAVGAVDRQKQVAFYSNQGREIDLVAPGGDTNQDGNGDGFPDGVVQETRQGGSWSYYFLQGTSMAAPHVSGAAALVYGRGVHDPDQVARLLTQTANDLGSKGWDKGTGHGLVDPVQAVRGKVPPGGREGKGGKEGKSGEGLQIVDTRIRRGEGTSRATIAWLTDAPADTTVRGSNGFQDHSGALVKSHRMTVRGKAGETVTFTLSSASAKDKATDTVKVNF